jgi:flagellar hook assembly protein FlgD
VLVDGVKERGSHEATWDGRDGAGSSVSSGVYFYRLTAGKFSESRKMVLLK